jgi:hypothetical protein
MDYGQVRRAETKLRCVRARGAMRLVKQYGSVTIGPNNDDMEESDDAVLASSAVRRMAEDGVSLAPQQLTASSVQHGQLDPRDESLYGLWPTSVTLSATGSSISDLLNPEPGTLRARASTQTSRRERHRFTSIV